MKYVLVHNGTCDQGLYQIEKDDFFKGNAELIMYYDDSFSANNFSKNELIALEPWVKQPTPQKQAPESSINVALLEQF